MCAELQCVLQYTNAHTYWQALGIPDWLCQHRFLHNTQRSQNHLQLLMRWLALRPRWNHPFQSCWSVFESCWWYAHLHRTSQYVGGVFPWQCRLASGPLWSSALGGCSQCYQRLQQWLGALEHAIKNKTDIVFCVCTMSRERVHACINCTWLIEQYIRICMWLC